MVAPRFISRLRLVVAILALATGCIHRTPDTIGDDEDDTVTVNVVNHHLLDVTVYNVAHGHRDRLGQVTAVSQASYQLHLRRFISNDIQLFGTAIGSSESVRAEILHLSPGDTVVWTLESDLVRSHLAVR